MEEEITRIDQQIESILRESEEVDQREDEMMGDCESPYEVQDELRDKERLRERLRGAKEKLWKKGSKEINLTDEESRIMPVAGGGFEQCYNAQAIVDTETLLVVVAQVVQAANDKQQVRPMLTKLQALPNALSQPKQFLADAGYFSEANVGACEEAGIEPLIALKRGEHHPHWSERFSEPPAPAPEATVLERIRPR